MELVEDERVDFKALHLTGYFRDGIRRVDLVLVAKYSGSEEVEEIKAQFLATLMNAGLEVEIEEGFELKHRGLHFIKIHTPSRIIKHFGFFFFTKKFFKTSHLNISSEFVKNERDLIKIMRSEYPDPQTYSTFERSVLAYKILHSATFGDYENYIGIQRLLSKRIFLDLYPLHDGPYFFVRRQSPTTFNGRQALKLNWIGYDNLYQLQPIHLIREYFGERIAFLFTFYQFYNFVMFLMGLLGIGLFFVNRNMKSRQKLIKAVKNEVHNYLHGNITFKKFPVCPKCGDFVGCPFRYMQEYAREVHVKLALDCPWSVVFSLVFVIMSLIAYLIWRRIESHLNWLWELHVKEHMSMRRPEYKPKRTDEKKGKFAAIMRSQLMRKIKNILIMLGLLVLYVFIILPDLITFMQKLWNRYRYIEEEFDETITPVGHGWAYPEDRAFRATALTTFVLSVVNATVICVMEKIWWAGAKWLTVFWNNRTEKQYDIYTYSFIFNFGLLLFVAFVKDVLFTYPGDEERWYLPLQLGSMNCGMMKCLDEIFIIYVATYRCKLLFDEFLSVLESFYRKTDAPTEYINSDFGYIPCWEREYRLKPVDEDFVMQTYNYIMIDFTTGLLFVTLFPLGPIILFVINVFKIRYLAKALVMHSRRPLISQNWGLGTWKYVLFAIPFILAIVHALHLAINSHVINKNFFDRHFANETKKPYFGDYHLSFFDLHETDFYGSKNPKSYNATFKTFRKHWLSLYTKTMVNLTIKNKKPKRKNFYSRVSPDGVSLIDPKICFFAGHYQLSEYKKTVKYTTYGYVPAPIKYALYWNQSQFVFVYLAIVVLMSMLLHYLIRPCSQTVKKNHYKEGYVLEYHHRALRNQQGPYFSQTARYN